MQKYPGTNFRIHGNAGDFGHYYTWSNKAKQSALKQKRAIKQTKHK